jgi:hypothetical protein
LAIVQTKLLRLLNDHEKPLFPDNQLAYLALTGKVEQQFRDALAWRMATWAENPHWVVAREYAPKAKGIKQKERGRLCDLAVLEDSGRYRPVAMMEFKAMTTRNSKSTRFLDDVRSDLQYWEGDGCDELIGVLLAVHVEQVVQRLVFSEGVKSRAIKYMKWVERAMKRPGELEKTRKECSDFIADNLKDELIGHGRVEGGTAFGAKVEVLFWVVRLRPH